MKTRLQVDYEFDFELIGLISASKGYKLAWLINQKLKLDLQKDEELELSFFNEARLLIESYVYKTAYSSFRLIKNKSVEFANIARPYLVPELKDYDYLIKIKDEGDMYNNMDRLCELLKEVSAIQFIQVIDINSLKSKENLIF